MSPQSAIHYKSIKADARFCQESCARILHFFQESFICYVRTTFRKTNISNRNVCVLGGKKCQVFRKFSEHNKRNVLPPAMLTTTHQIKFDFTKQKRQFKNALEKSILKMRTYPKMKAGLEFKFWPIQKLPPILLKTCSYKFCKIHRKVFSIESFLVELEAQKQKDFVAIIFLKILQKLF